MYIYIYIYDMYVYIVYPVLSIFPHVHLTFAVFVGGSGPWIISSRNFVVFGAGVLLKTSSCSLW